MNVSFDFPNRKKIEIRKKEKILINKPTKINFKEMNKTSQGMLEIMDVFQFIQVKLVIQNVLILFMETLTMLQSKKNNLTFLF